MNKYILCCFLMFPLQTYAVTCEITNDKSPVVYFIGGVLATNGNTTDAVFGLTASLRNTNIRTIRSALNSSRGIYDDLIEAAEQRQAEPPAIKRWLANIGIASSWFKEEFADSIVNTANAQYINNFDLREMTNSFLAALRSGRKVVVIAHSQGNFFANSAYQYISQNFPEYRQSIGLVAVGSPSGIVQDGGSHFRNSWDLVINVVDSFYDVLPSNFIFTSSDLSGHRFAPTYLRARGVAISSAIVNTVNRLTTPALHNGCDPTSRAEVETVADPIPGTTTANFRARLTKGEDAKVWSVYSIFSDQVECQESQFQGQTTYDAVSVVGSQPTDLQPQTTYYHRACAIGKDNVLVSGARRTLKTKQLVLNCGETLSVTGGTNGYNAVFNVGTTRSGPSVITFQTFQIPDRLTISGQSHGQQLLETGFVSELNQYNVSIPRAEQAVLIRVIGNNISTTKWEFSMTCP